MRVSVLSTRAASLTRARPREGTWSRTALAAACYLSASVALFHGVMGNLAARAPLGGTGDVAQMTWFQAWTAWAIAHGHDPFVSHMVNAPHGVNLMWNTAMPLAGAVMTPVTLTWGPLASVNLLFILGPAATALTTRWWLFRHVRSELARLVGGAALGFGPFIAAHLGGHLNFTFLVLVPVILRLGEDVLWRSRGRRRPAILLGLAVAGQALLSEEVLLLVVIGAAVFLLAALVFVPELRHVPPAAVVRGMGLAVVVALALLAWPLAVQLLGPDRVRGVNTAPYFAQPRDLIEPSTHEWFGSADETRALVARGTSAFKDGVYLGVPALLVIVAAAIAFRRQVWTRVGLLAAAVIVLLSFGSGAHGHLWTGIEHPLAAVLSPPVASSIVPQRFGLVLDVFAAWCLAQVTDHAVARLASARAMNGAWRRYVPGVVGIVAVMAVVVSWVPAPPAGQAAAPVPAFFTADAGTVLPRGARVVLLPAPDRTGDQAMLYQAVAGMRFSMLGSYATSVNRDGVADSHASPDALTAVAGEPTSVIRESAAAIRRRIASAGVDAILLVPADDPGGRLGTAVRAVYGSPDSESGGVDLWWTGAGRGQ